MGGGTPLPPAPPVAPVPPFNPDWTILSSIKGAKLRALYTQLLNLETQINAATVAGNAGLVTTLTNTLNQIQGQINSFVPPGRKPTPTPPVPPPKTAPIVTTQDIRNSLNFFGKWLAQNPGASLANVQQAWVQTWAGYKQTPGFAQFVNNGWQQWLAGNPQPGQLGGGPIQSFTGFRQTVLRQYDQLADKPTQAVAQTGSHLRVVA